MRTHDCNLQKLLIEIFKIKVKLAPEIINEVFDIKECPDPLANKLTLKSQNIHILKYAIKTATLAGLRICSYMPSELKENTSLNKSG